MIRKFSHLCQFLHSLTGGSNVAFMLSSAVLSVGVEDGLDSLHSALNVEDHQKYLGLEACNNIYL